MLVEERMRGCARCRFILERRCIALVLLHAYSAFVRQLVITCRVPQCPDNYVRQAPGSDQSLVSRVMATYLPSMRLIPTHCDACGRATLTAAGAIEAGSARCAACGGQARTVPGSSYGPGDAALYDRLAQGLRDAGVTAAGAAALSAELNPALGSGAPGEGMRRLLVSLPALGALGLNLDGDPQQLRKLEGMLTTLLSGIGSGRAPSGMVPAVPQQRP